MVSGTQKLESAMSNVKASGVGRMVRPPKRHTAALAANPAVRAPACTKGLNETAPGCTAGTT